MVTLGEGLIMHVKAMVLIHSVNWVSFPSVFLSAWHTLVIGLPDTHLSIGLLSHTRHWAACCTH